MEIRGQGVLCFFALYETVFDSNSGVYPLSDGRQTAGVGRSETAGLPTNLGYNHSPRIGLQGKKVEKHGFQRLVLWSSKNLSL